ncbi:ABC-type dipeptide/oligopeptide/nickel transport system ATPase component [Clostridium tetanomorphum]|uniref:ABC transporter ATP-binding protein n=1 Tax=Clostridium tetanomorphum TaxID=1553 RepID=A0A923J1A5_CLOTT|nr:ATP-binding cassette domain-containing protein [Clostridium tetanomorphum]KAJ50786.1 oligopeptide ABC transport system ATP-binding protein OppD4 [Clostridium tetanomorphum DSM 665]MBC2398574.1 ABC transporter ATP-binding protein [Clostridium tetanomorphum]MBP1866415.1 ABC-type dipeptide/oligopeptide/nickel transport system ATPase component [Clostridium tetanomorphum]NRS83193.1 ABC-type dipeptide/oligopeptide/nickel transport system ATPase component [Clostridium tetanomorphum]NRZ98707.1 ABC-
MNLLEVKNLSIKDIRNNEEIVSNISFELKSNTCLGIVGESGSGKSMTTKAILGLTNPWLKVTGSAKFNDIELLKAKSDIIRKIRGKNICMILQDAMSSFDALYTIGYQMIETLQENGNISKKEAEKISVQALDKMCINDPKHEYTKYLIDTRLKLTDSFRKSMILEDEVCCCK